MVNISILYNQWKDQVLFSSYLVRSLDNGMHLNGPVKGKGITEGGTEVFLYQRAYDELTHHQYGLFRPGHVVLEVKKPEDYVAHFTGEKGVQWLEQHSYWYQLSVPPDYNGNLYSLMAEDLKRYFRLEAAIEKKMVNCMVLVRTSGRDKLITKGGAVVNTFRKVDARSKPAGPVRYLTNQPYSLFSERIRGLTEYGFHLPFQDSTGMSGKIDFQMKGEILDNITLDKLQAVLNTYDLDLIEKPCLLDVLVLKEPKS